MLNDLSRQKEHIIYMPEASSEKIEYALYPVKEIQDLYTYKVKYQRLLRQCNALTKQYPALQEFLSTHSDYELLDEE